MNFTVYTRNGCPYCTQIKQVLEGKGYNYQEYKLGVDFQREAFYNQFGQGSTFPQVVLNSSNLGGCTDTVRYLKEQNLLYWKNSMILLTEQVILPLKKTSFTLRHTIIYSLTRLKENRSQSSLNLALLYH